MKNTKEKIFMSYRHHSIWYTINKGTIYYMVALGDGTDKYFDDFAKAMDWIDTVEDKK